MAGRSVSFAKRRVVKVGSATVVLEALGAIPGPYYVSILDAEGQPAKTLEITSEWWPGQPVWTRHGRGRRGCGAGSPDPQRHDALLSRHPGADPRLYEREAELAALMPDKVPADMSKFLLCPMPGLVKAINVAEGQDVKAGDSLAIVEAMKMENILKAERDGKVKKVIGETGRQPRRRRRHPGIRLSGLDRNTVSAEL